MAYPVSDYIKQLFEGENRQVARVTLTPVSGSTVVITEADIVQGSFVIDRATSSSDNLEIGSCIASEFSMTLFNETGKFNGVEFEGGEMFVEVGVIDPSNNNTYYIPMGYFTIDDAPKVRQRISIVALDRMMFFDKYIPVEEYATWAVAGHTVQEHIQYCCSRCGIALATSVGSFANALYQITAPPDVDSLTYRQILAWCCQMMGKNAYIDWEGKLRIGFPVAHANDGTYAIAGLAVAGIAIVGKTNSSLIGLPVNTEHDRFGSDVEDYTITTTGVYFDDADNTRYIIGTDDYAFDLSDNEMLYEPEKIIPNLGSLVGITYTPFSASTIPYPWVYPMDWFVYQKNSVNYMGIVTNVTFKLNSHLEISSVGESPKARSYARNNGMTSAQSIVLKKAEAKINQSISNARADAINNATSLIKSSLHGYIVFNDKDEDGIPDELLIMSEACYLDFYSANPTYTVGSLWRWNKNGLGYSETGYDGTYGLAMTIDGSIVADYITTGTLNADLIRTGILRGVLGGSYWNLNTGELHIEGYATSDDLDEAISSLGNIEVWSGASVPTLNNYPANEWTSTAEKTNHIGDIYYDGDGNAYRFMQNSSGTFEWTLITDSVATSALEKANQALATFGDYYTKVETTSLINASSNAITMEVDATYQTKDAMSAYSNTDEVKSLIQESAGEILLTVSGEYSTKADLESLEIGGRNIIRGTADIQFADGEDYDGTWDTGSFVKLGGTLASVNIASTSPIPAITKAIRITGTNSSLPLAGIAIAGVAVVGGSSGFIQNAYSMQGHIGDSLVYSAWFKGKAGDMVSMIAYSGDGEVASQDIKLTSSSWERHYFVTPLVGYNHEDIAIGGIVYIPALKSNSLLVCGMKLEFGNKVTSWSPAPEDINTRVDKTEASIQVLSDEIDLRVTKEDYNGQQIVSYINQTADTIKIQAAHLELTGAVTLSSLDTNLKKTVVTGTVPVYYRSTSPTAPEINASTNIQTTSDSDNVWQYTMPTPKYGRYYFTCEKYTSADGTVTFSTVTQMPNLNYTAQWCSSNNATFIDGARIYTGSITADQLDSNSVTAGKIDVSDLSAIGAKIGGFSIDQTAIYSGTKGGTTSGYITLSTADFDRSINGTSRTLRFAIGSRFGVAGDGSLYASSATISGSITSSSGTIGGFTIGSSSLKNGMTSLSDTTNDGVYLGSDGIALGKGAFKVTNAGVLTVKSGTIGGFTIDATSIRSGTLPSTSSGNIGLSTTDFTRTIGSTSRSGLRFAIGSKFGVTGDGTTYLSSLICSSATITGGSIEITSGTSDFSAIKLTYSANITELLSSGLTVQGTLSGTVYKALYTYDGIVCNKGSGIAAVYSSNSIILGTTIAITASTGNIKCTKINSYTPITAGNISDYALTSIPSTISENKTFSGTVTFSSTVTCNGTLKAATISDCTKLNGYTPITTGNISSNLPSSVITTSNISSYALTAIPATVSCTTVKVGNYTTISSNYMTISDSSTATERYVRTLNSKNNVELNASTNAGIWHRATTGYSTAGWLIYIQTDGTIKTQTTSDKRKKDEVSVISEHEAESVLSGVTPINFTYKSDIPVEQRTINSGIYAQDLRDVLINENIGHRGYLIISDNSEDGSDSNDLFKDESEVTYGIDYAKLVPVLIKGWQMHEAKIAELERLLAEK